MVSSTSIFLAVSLLVSFVSYSEQFQCYNCVELPEGVTISDINQILGQINANMTINSPDCGEYADGLLRDCVGTNAACYSYTVSLDGTGQDKLTGRVKTCDAEGKYAATCTAIDTRSLSVELACDTCTEDRCNSATSTTASLLLIASPALLYKLLH